jgi:hypothetical protein
MGYLLNLQIKMVNSQFTNEQLELFSKYEKAGKSVEEINFIKEQVLLCKTNELWVLDEVTNQWYINSNNQNK